MYFRLAATLTCRTKPLLGFLASSLGSICFIFQVKLVPNIQRDRANRPMVEYLAINHTSYFVVCYEMPEDYVNHSKVRSISIQVVFRDKITFVQTYHVNNIHHLLLLLFSIFATSLTPLNVILLICMLLQYLTLNL